jgi:RNA polymerase II subunit A small phosphatase-like protein
MSSASHVISKVKPTGKASKKSVAPEQPSPVVEPNSQAQAGNPDKSQEYSRILNLHRQRSDEDAGMLLRGASFMCEPISKPTRQPAKPSATKSRPLSAAVGNTAAGKATDANNDGSPNPVFGSITFENPTPTERDGSIQPPWQGFSLASPLLTDSGATSNAAAKRKRGRANSTAESADGAEVAELGLLQREPTMIKSDRNKLVGSPTPGKLYTFVLDLDETLIYARDGPLFARAHLKEMLLAMDKVGEVVVWTAGDRDYAKAVLKQINVGSVVKHLVYRHRHWFNESNYTKDLTKLGRNLDYVFILENTPDCLRKNPGNGIIVSDFEGGTKKDATLLNVIKLVEDMGRSQLPVPLFLQNCSMLKKQTVEQGKYTIDILYLGSKKLFDKPGRKSAATGPDADAGRARSASPSSTANALGTPPAEGDDGDVKVVKVNRDKKSKPATTALPEENRNARAATPLLTTVENTTTAGVPSTRSRSRAKATPNHGRASPILDDDSLKGQLQLPVTEPPSKVYGTPTPDDGGVSPAYSPVNSPPGWMAGAPSSVGSPELGFFVPPRSQSNSRTMQLPAGAEEAFHAPKEVGSPGVESVEISEGTAAGAKPAAAKGSRLTKRK